MTNKRAKEVRKDIQKQVKQPKDFEVNHHKPMVYKPFQYLGMSK